MIRLVGGQLNGTIIHDSGNGEINMFPVSNDELFGYAKYELNEERTLSFYDGIVWVGAIEKVHRGEHFEFGE